MSTKSREVFTMHRSSTRAAIVALAALISLAVAAIASTVPSGKKYPTGEAAIEAFVAAVRQGDTGVLTSIFGKDSERVFETGDPVVDRTLRTDFLKLYDAKHTSTPRPDGSIVLVVGPNAWPFPIPLVKKGNEWGWDTASGIDEIINRRIGLNELEAIQTSLAIGDAERDYFMQDRDGDGILQYARKFLSADGKHDGLYWPTKPGEPLSPLGEFAARASDEGYAAGEANPYHGYYYRLLSSQGKSAPGGAYDYMAHGKQIGGFAIVACPAAYGDTGIMTFMTSHSGIVYQKDLGKDTWNVARKITTFDPGPGWKQVAPKDLQPIPEE